jgi:chromate reductase
MSYHLLAISGSLRKGSYNTALLHAWKKYAPEGVDIELLSADDIRALPPYDTDLEQSAYPESASKLKERIRAADALIISTPEYNRSVPGVLKNLLDWTTRPTGDVPYAEKPVYVMGASSGPIGTALAQYDLKKMLLYFNARPMGQPEFYCGTAKDKFDAEGNLTDEKTVEYIKKGYTAFLSFIESNR